MASKIKELLRQTDNVLIFDIDGVLAVQEWGEYNHFDLTDNEWSIMAATQSNFYTKEYVSPKMQDYLKDKDKSRTYVISKSYTKNEDESKAYFANTFYGIPRENIIMVRDDAAKVDKLIEIMKKYPDLPRYKIIMIEDTVRVLNDVREKTNCATVHISSFLDL